MLSNVTVWDEITYPFPNFNGCIQQFIMDVIIYQIYNYS